MGSNKRKVLANVDRLHHYMDQNRLAAVVGRSGKNFTYLTGVVYPGTLARHQEFPDSDRGVMVVWPRSGDPVIVTNQTAAGVTQRDSWVEKLELYEGYTEPPFECLAKVLKSMGLAAERVGLEKDYVSARDWELLGRLVPEMDRVDCTAMMDEVRWVKTPGEIELLRQAADVLDEVYLEVFPRICPGVTERDVHSDIIYGCLRRGAGWAHGMLNASSNSTPYCGEGDTAFAPGDLVTTDYVSYLQGYPGHQNRNAVVGKPTQQQIDTYRAYREVYAKVIDFCRPGVTGEQVFDFSSKEFKKQGWNERSLLVGHGVGAWWHQQEPTLTRGNKITLEEGMVLAVEPHLNSWSVQDMIVVRKNAPQWLSERFNTDELFVCG